MWPTTALQSHAVHRPALDSACMIQLQADARSGAKLREIVIRVGQDAVRFLRIDGGAGQGALRALLCIEAHAVPVLRQELQRRLPDSTWHHAPQRARRRHAD